jgi:hypothetical protein
MATLGTATTESRLDIVGVLNSSTSVAFVGLNSRLGLGGRFSRHDEQIDASSWRQIRISVVGRTDWAIFRGIYVLQKGMEATDNFGTAS